MENQNSANSGGDASKSNYKVKLMCSYGGKIQQRPHDHQLTYVGGDTKIIAVDRHIKLSDIVAKLISLCNSADVSFKYQLPGEDLDALVSVINDDDLEHMMNEYDSIDAVSSKPARLRLFLFSPAPSMKTGLDQPITVVPSSAPFNPDFLFGFDKEYDYDYQTHSILKSEIPRGLGTIGPYISGLDPLNGAEIQAQIQGITFTGQGLDGLHDTFSRESHVTGGSYTEGGVAAAGQMVYRIPMTTGGFPGGAGQYGMQTVRVVPGIIYREQPVYNFVPPMPSASEQKLGWEEGGLAHVATDDGGRSVVYNAVGALSAHPRVTMAATFCHDAENNI